MSPLTFRLPCMALALQTAVIEKGGFTVLLYICNGIES